MDNLADVVGRSGARVVLSSDRRRDFVSRQHTSAVLASRGVRVLGWTECGLSSARAASILAWVDAHNTSCALTDETHETNESWGRIECFAVVDEKPLVVHPGGEFLVGRFVMLAPGRGLTNAAANALVMCLHTNQVSTHSTSASDDYASGESSTYTAEGHSRPDSRNSSSSRSSSGSASSFSGKEIFSNSSNSAAHSFRWRPSRSKRFFRALRVGTRAESLGNSSIGVDDTDTFTSNEPTKESSKQDTFQKTRETRETNFRFSVSGVAARMSVSPRKTSSTASAFEFGVGVRFLGDHETTTHVVRYQ